MTEHLILLRQQFYLVNLMFIPYKFILPYKVIFHEEEKKKILKKQQILPSLFYFKRNHFLSNYKNPLYIQIITFKL